VFRLHTTRPYEGPSLRIYLEDWKGGCFGTIIDIFGNRYDANGMRVCEDGKVYLMLRQEGDFASIGGYNGPDPYMSTSSDARFSGHFVWKPYEIVAVEEDPDWSCYLPEGVREEWKS
jgi:hypothetical protein